ncbi:MULTISPECIES: hypothetical protein [unclassified Microcoleus]|uniref:hypothetical protein n=1 Tax=unclassified Microcoleus TaxID=2642155 RepID=UPI002FD08304
MRAAFHYTRRKKEEGRRKKEEGLTYPFTNRNKLLLPPLARAGRFHSHQNQAFVGAVPPCPPPPTDDFTGVWDMGATTGGLPLQENETAPP